MLHISHCKYQDARGIKRANYCYLKLVGYWLKYQISSTRYQVSDIKYHISHIKYQISSIRYQVSDIEYQIKCIIYNVSDIKSQISNIKYQVSGVKYHVASIRMQRESRESKLLVFKIPKFQLGHFWKKKKSPPLFLRLPYLMWKTFQLAC